FNTRAACEAVSAPADTGTGCCRDRVDSISALPLQAGEGFNTRAVCEAVSAPADTGTGCCRDQLVLGPALPSQAEKRSEARCALAMCWRAGRADRSGRDFDAVGGDAVLGRLHRHAGGAVGAEVFDLLRRELPAGQHAMHHGRAGGVLGDVEIVLAE